MEIIKKGIIKKKEWRATCATCHCEFIYNEHDITVDPRDGDYVNCPTCGAYINVMGRKY